MPGPGRFHICSVVALTAVLLLSLCTPAGAAEAAAGERGLLEKYGALRSDLQKNQFGAPIALLSHESKGAVSVDMYGVFNHPFEAVREALRSPDDWCDITLLHINIKACTYRAGVGESLLTLYSGRKYYQPPVDAYPLKLRFRVISDQPGYLSLALDAEEGPLRTKDHRITVEAAPLDFQRTFIHFSYGYAHGAMARMAIHTYFSTLGRDKIGFSLVGKGDDRHFVEGVRGAIERNTMRYYLALQSYLDTLKLPEGQRFEQRLNRWFDLTSKYPRQLKEMEKGEYLSQKRREHANQLEWQKKEPGGKGAGAFGKEPS